MHSFALIKILLTTEFAGWADGQNSSDGSELEVVRKPYRLTDLARRVRMVLNSPTGNSSVCRGT
ncbi:hypothetical protein GNX71_16345 [Variovorax sp. RKNM96]|uniref:hypothetical protein n=1 Tax=Variovorax sp. RKNM96 TaxID=2681552 RepID=UPI00197D767A|nr:hypothetical protein [Variovorax sp. RKNM96]QSI31055.1 hypothetical protein GNX71_16345 [Variovorax sp. RKNM96]